jgi:hypothetical protein
MALPRAEHSERPGWDTVVLWAALLVGPLTVLAAEWGAYALVPGACARRNGVFVHAVHLAALLLVAWGFVASLRAWERLGRGEPDEQPGPDHRARYMAFSGMISNVFFAVVLACFWVADFVIGACQS